MERLCPDCRKQLVREEYFGVNLDVCRSCAGIWFDEGELGQLLQEGSARLVEIDDAVQPELSQLAGAASRRDCPDCLEPLMQYRYAYDSPVVLDSCPSGHGFWVEDGELDKIRAWIDLSRQRRQSSGSDPAEAALAMANFEIEHDAEMRRLDNLSTFFTLWRRRPYGRFLGWW